MGNRKLTFYALDDGNRGGLAEFSVHDAAGKMIGNGECWISVPFGGERTACGLLKTRILADWKQKFQNAVSVELTNHWFLLFGCGDYPAEIDAGNL